MKKLLFLIVLLGAWSCSDGDLQIETIDFDDISIQQCGSVSTSTTLFFKIDSDETLILDLQNGLLDNEATTDTIRSTIPNQSQLTYRIFSDNVSSNYFCDEIPPSTPIVVEEIEAIDGEILITTVEIDSVTYDHTILLNEVSLINSLGERITDLSISDFGTITTTTD
ncbi:MAG: hypothetical protein AAGB24_09630 [Bacteroidota bacterium]